MVYIGCDTGGTFTDFVFFSPSRGLVTLKLSSTPDDPSRAVLDGIDQLCPGAPPRGVNHATTVATNSLLEKTGGRICFITTEGFGDLLWLGRGERRELYSLCPTRVEPLVRREHVLEVSERVGSDASILKSPAEIPLLEDDFDAVAVCLLHASLNPEHELALERRFSGQRVFLSHRVAPGSGEYERATTTVLAAYLSVRVQRYLENLQSRLSRTELHIVHSAGGLLTAEEAMKRPHRLALSGPAAGLRGALEVGLECGLPNLVTLDMGGTSTDVAMLAEGELPYAWQTRIEGYPLRAPTLEIHTIGAGGGSIARVDAGGLLRVGPRSAGATPGPACYGRGGSLPTVTDAFCWNGFLPGSLGNEELVLSRQAAGEALDTLSGPLGLETDQVAAGILELSCAHLAEAVRRVTAGQGRDPSRFTLFPFGGAGPLLACQVAESLAMDTILVPSCAGVLSAWGALAAPWEREWSLLVPPHFRGEKGRETEYFQQLRARARAEFKQDQELRWFELVERRYRGQGETLVSAPHLDFHELHQSRFGFTRRNQPIETVQIRLRARRPPLSGLRLPAPGPSSEPTRCTVRWKDEPLEVAVYSQPPASLQGPALILQAGSTLFVAPRWKAEVGEQGHLLLSFRGPSR